MISHLRIIVILICCTTSVHADKGISTFKRISTTEGLSNRRVMSMAKDAKGYYWFATRLAVDRFDGIHFESFKLSDQEKVRSVVSNRKGEIYAFTEKKIYKFNDGRVSFDSVCNVKVICERGVNSSINAVGFDESGRIWVGTTSGLYYSINGGKWNPIKELSKKAVFSLSDKHDGYFFAGTANGVYQIRCIDGEEPLVSSVEDLKKLNDFRIQSLYYDQITQNLWLGTFSEGLFIYNLSNRTLKASNASQDNTPPIRTIRCVTNSEVWVGYDGLGIFVYNRFDGSSLKSYTQSNDPSLGSNGIYYIYSEGNATWVCTYTAGIFVKDRTKVNFENILPGGGVKGVDIHVNIIFEDSDGDIWYGTNNGINVYNPNTRSWRSFLKQKTNSVILSIFEDRNRDIWVGGYAVDFVKIKKKSGDIKKIDLPAIEMSHTSQNYIYSITQDSEGYLWLGGVMSMLIRYDPVKNAYRQYDVKGINKILDYDKDRLILATVNGLFFFDKKRGIASRISLRKDAGIRKYSAFPFINNVVKDISNNSVVWAGTDGLGLLRLNVVTGELRQYDIGDALASDYVYGINFDQLKRIWVSTENGISCINTGTGNSVFTIQGFPENVFNFLAYCRLKNGNLIWGTPRGAIEINPANIKTVHDGNLNLHFNEFYIHYDKVTTATADSPLSRSIDSTRKIVLGYSQHSFSFEFSNVSYPVNKNIQYSWMLKGFDKDWNFPTNDHKAVYTNIPPGRYTFLVKAVDLSNGLSKIRSVEIVIKPPFWVSPFAYILYAILLGALLLLILKAYHSRIEAANSEEKINFFINMAHDIRVPITLIKAPLNEIEQESLSDSGRIALSLAQRNTQKLFSMVSQLIDFQKVGLNAVKLKVEEVDINNFFNELIYNFKVLAKDKELVIDFVPLNENEKGWFDRQKITLVMENLLSNAIKYTPVKGNIAVKIQTSSGGLHIEVSDTGIGIPENQHYQIFNRFFRADNTVNSNEVGSGIGLLLTKKLVTLHKGSITFISKEKQGTTFIIALPYDKSAYTDSEIISYHKEKEVKLCKNEDNQQLSILLVEDNEELRLYLARILGKEYRVIQAGNGEEALHFLKSVAPDFIISDIIMPKISGVELCRKVKSDIEICHIPILLLSSVSDKDEIIKGLNAGADDFVSKPFDLPILLNKIKTILNNRKLIKRRYMDKVELIENNMQLNELDRDFMQKVIQAVEDNMSSEDFSVETLASELAMSRSVFFKKIKALTDQSPADLVREMRMKRAAELIMEQRYSINEIAYLTGFPNPKYFSTAFKKFYGCSPSVYLDREVKDL